MPQIDETARLVQFTLPDGVSGTLAFSACPQLTILDAAGRPLHADLPLRPFTYQPAAGREGGLTWYSLHKLEDVCMGLGEKAAPTNIARRRWAMRATNAAHYDAFNSDPLYKNLPFLLVLPNPLDPVRQRFQRARESPLFWAGLRVATCPLTRSNAPAPPLDPAASPPRATGVFTPSNGSAVWDLGHSLNDPLGEVKSYAQVEGPIDAFVSWGDSGADVKRGWRTLLKGDGGRDTLAARSWLGYLASTMGQAESDDPPAQELLLDFPKQCRAHGIPCSGMHLSSGYTVDKKTGFRMVFQWNKDRYPDFEGLMRAYHEDGIKVCANIKVRGDGSPLPL